MKTTARKDLDASLSLIETITWSNLPHCVNSLITLSLRKIENQSFTEALLLLVYSQWKTKSDLMCFRQSSLQRLATSRFVWLVETT